jgi:hypothetical protein
MLMNVDRKVLIDAYVIVDCYGSFYLRFHAFEVMLNCYSNSVREVIQVGSILFPISIGNIDEIVVFLMDCHLAFYKSLYLLFLIGSRN